MMLSTAQYLRVYLHCHSAALSVRLSVCRSVRCEQLLGVNGKLRQELMLIGEIIPELQERLAKLLQVLIQRCSHSPLLTHTDLK